MVGMLCESGKETIVTFDHSEMQPTVSGKEIVQGMLDRTTILIMHNAPHDLMWLWESGFEYDGAVFDTMLNAYVLQRGQKQPLSLEACAERYQLDTKKQDTLKAYFKKGYSTKDIPFDELSMYLSADLHATQQLHDKLIAQLENTDKELASTAKLTDEVAVCLARIYQRGFSVDRAVLEEVRVEFETERKELVRSLDWQCRDVMGDFPINLNSPEQLSWVIYSRKPHEKATWASRFDAYMNPTDYRSTVRSNSSIVYKKKAKQCTSCYGNGQIRKTKKDGKPFSKPSKCPDCYGVGYVFTDIPNSVAGLKFNAPNAKWVSANGFSTSKGNIELLESMAKARNMPNAVTFLKNVRRLSALDTYLSSFIDGITTHTKTDGKLHVRLLQHRTSTGRFSGADPNMQNMPRGGTFPVKKVFVSRWEGGQIMEADFAQLEFRVAAFLGQDKIAMKEVSTGFDVHAYTAKVITEGGQPTSRQEAKAHTFAPLYGASGYGRTPAEAKYYEQFTKKYSGIAEWHGRLATEALNTGKIRTPSGREFLFPDVIRRRNGTVSYFTQIKNYPVQSFATADIVPISLLHIDKLLKDLNSCIVNTVHDSIVVDVHPDEVQQVVDIISQTNDVLKNLIDKQWDIDFNVPLMLEAKIGNNWLDTKDVI
jgi:DNA polymerase I-like protein with 3'-5' exonuclease and polymerase domains